MKLEMKRDWAIIFVLALATLIFFLSGSTTAVGEATYCCEKSAGGAWCQNSPPAVCDDNYRSAPTSCEATSYCRLGTCVDRQEGTCLENTPERVCEDSNGVWVEGEPDEIPQCQLGCCLIGDQAAFVTQTRCKRLASLYDLDINFRTDIDSEVECIASATPEVKGACVFDRDFERTCRLLTKGECLELKAGSSEEESIEFHEGFLCSSESLATNCGPTQRTTCVEDDDKVYFVDSCGNLANIYDASKINNKEYWSEIKDVAESCNPDLNNAGSASCGNCNYFLGSICKAYERGNTQTIRPLYGDFVCADLSCKYKGQTFQHGETWCADSPGTDQSLPGSEHFRAICYDAEVTIEACDSFRSTVCLQDEINGFKTAGCAANRWRDCVVQESQEDCENTDHRDCQWIEGESLLKDDEGRPLIIDEDGELVQMESGDKRSDGASCVPLYAPGFDFWNAEGEVEDLCLVASEDCVVRFTKRLIGGWNCKENCECLEDDWEDMRNNMCVALGDCGSSKNYAGIEGFNNKSAIVIKPLEDE
jgi:hypothetical protein